MGSRQALLCQCCPLVVLRIRHSPDQVYFYPVWCDFQFAAASVCVFAGVYILIAVGAVMMLVGFLGCYGAIQESQCLLGTVSTLFFDSHQAGTLVIINKRL